MLKLLLDEHIFSGIAEMTAKLAPALKAHSIHDWREGRLLNQPDLRILREACKAVDRFAATADAGASAAPALHDDPPTAPVTSR